jgi:hypothetical protein
MLSNFETELTNFFMSYELLFEARSLLNRVLLGDCRRNGERLAGFKFLRDILAPTQFAKMPKRPQISPLCSQILPRAMEIHVSLDTIILTKRSPFILPNDKRQ